MSDQHPSEFDVAVSRTPAPLPPPNEAEEIADLLESHGVCCARELVQSIERLTHKLAFRLAAEGLRRVLRSLPPSPANVAVERAVLGDGETLAEAAARAGCSRQAIHKAEAKARARLTSAALIE